MSEHWKSTPKYWCKHCKAFVRDTKLERQNHDATPRHQGNIKRFLRDLHRGHEKEEKDKERAKSEVARLNGLVSGTGHTESSTSSAFGRGQAPSIPKPQATPSQRKQQLAQLAEMGVSIPNEFRGEMAMAGEWQVTSERVMDASGSQDKKPEAIGFGVRKRAAAEDDEEAEVMATKKRRWGSTYRAHPRDDDDADLDALLSEKTVNAIASSSDTSVKQELLESLHGEIKPLLKVEPDMVLAQHPIIKKEPSDGQVKNLNNSATPAVVDSKDVSDIVGGNMFFKRRKAKNIRQK